MEQWEYTELEIPFKGWSYDYVIKLDDGTKLKGVSAIVNHWASFGWELVSIFPIEYERPGITSNRATRLMAVFRRKMGTQSAVQQHIEEAERSET